MAEFEEKLNSLLANPEAMAQIMQMAQSLGANPSGQQSSPQNAAPPPSAPPPGPLPFSPAGSGVDPGLILRLMPLIQELGGSNSNARQLLLALRPYLKAERQDKVERALQIARLFHVGKRFLSEWRG